MTMRGESAENCPRGGGDKHFWQAWVRTIFVAVK